MVKWLDQLHVAAILPLIAQQDPQVVARRLRGAEMVKGLSALTGLVILGFGMVALVWLGARFTRRYMNQGPSRPHSLLPDDWAEKPLVNDNDHGSEKT